MAADLLATTKRSDRAQIPPRDERSSLSLRDLSGI